MGSIGRISSLVSLHCLRSLIFFLLLTLSVVPLHAFSEKASARLQIEVRVVPVVQTNTVTLVNSLAVGTATGGTVSYSLSPDISPAPNSPQVAARQSNDSAQDVTADSAAGQRSIVETITVVEP
jgi:hypothetical protein